MSDVDLAVVIPTHNRRDMLLRGLEALAVQTYPVNQFEVVVMCDGCQDGTYEALQALVPPFRLRAFTQPQLGVSAARNNAAARTKAPVILFVDDDIIATPELLAEHMRAHEERSGQVVIGRLVPDPGLALPGWSRWEQQSWERLYEAFERREAHVTGRNFYSGNVSVDRLLFETVGGFDITCQRAEDVELGYRLQRAGATFSFNSRAVGIHCGVHSFDAWSRTQGNYGHYDVRLLKETGRLATLAVWYWRRNVLTRLLLRLALGRPTIQGLFIGLARASAHGTDWASVTRLSYLSYSVIANLRYWQRVADELGGVSRFWEFLDQQRKV